MALAPSRVTLRLALDPADARCADKARWAQKLVGAAEDAAPSLLRVESYDIGDTLLYIRMRSDETPKRLKKLFRDDESLMRLRARLADLGARPEFEIEGD